MMEEALKTNLVFVATIDLVETTGNIYTDLCDRVRVVSSRGNRYILSYDYDSNTILAKLIKK